jgi:hypothetical protein
VQHEPSPARDLDGRPEQIADEQYVRLVSGGGEARDSSASALLALVRRFQMHTER